MPDDKIHDSSIWRTAGGDGSRRGLFPTKVEIGSRPARQLTTEGAVQAAVVFDAERRAFVADLTGAVQAFSSEGQLLWRVQVPGGVSATPAVHSKKPQLFVGTHTGWICALDTASGDVLWREEIPTKADPRIVADLLYVPRADAVVLNSWGERFYALDAGSGKERFSWDAGIAPYAGASASSNGSIYSLRAVASQGVEFVGVDAEGQESVLHRVPEETRGARRTMIAAAPVLDEERETVYFIANRDRGSLLHAWSVQSNALLWSQALPNSVQATPAVRKDGVVLIPDLAGFVSAFKPDEAIHFRYASGCEYLLAGAVCEAGGRSFLGDPLGLFHSLDSRGVGRPIFEARRALQARPSFDPDGNLYVPATEGKVFVFAGTLGGHSPAPR